MFYNKKMNIKHRNCKNCGIRFLPQSCNHWWCGNHKQKIGCAYFQRETERKSKHYYHKDRANPKVKILNPKTYTLKKRFEVLKANNFKCSYCGISAQETKIEVDHITPRSKGGTHDIANLTTACWKCNEGKLNW